MRIFQQPKHHVLTAAAAPKIHMYWDYSSHYILTENFRNRKIFYAGLFTLSTLPTLLSGVNDTAWPVSVRREVLAFAVWMVASWVLVY